MRDWIGTETENAGKDIVMKTDVSGKVAALQAAVESVIKGKSDTVKFALIAVFARVIC